MLDRVLRHLEALVSFDTRNPPRDITTGGIFDYLRAQLPDFRCTVTDHGEGAVSLLAVRGDADAACSTCTWIPCRTPPAGRARRIGCGWRTAARSGLGACDIKGAAAGLVAAANATKGDAAFLFSSDEEANDARCIEAFLAQRPRLRRSHRRRAHAMRSGARASRHQFGVAALPGPGGACLGRGCDARQRAAPRDALGQSRAGLRRIAIAPALRRAHRPALQRRPRRRRHQGERDRAERGSALRLPSLAVDGLRTLARRPRHASPNRAHSRVTRKPSAVRRCLRAMSPRPKRAASKRATSPTNSACPSATRSISGPKPRCSRARA